MLKSLKVLLTQCLIVVLSLYILSGESYGAAKFRISSSSFDNGEAIPTIHASTYIKGGKNLSPALSWTAMPDGCQSLALLVWDTHKIAKGWIHWLVIDIPNNVQSIAEGASLTESMPKESLELINSFSRTGYGGPGPPKGSGIHTYIFTVYALNVKNLNLNGKISRKKFLQAIRGKVIQKATLKGTYRR